MKVKLLAEIINSEDNYFWKAGLIKETLTLWENKDNLSLLDDVAQVMVNTYLN